MMILIPIVSMLPILTVVAYQQYKFNNQTIKDCEELKRKTGWDIEIRLV